MAMFDSGFFLPSGFWDMGIQPTFFLNVDIIRI